MLYSLSQPGALRVRVGVGEKQLREQTLTATPSTFVPTNDEGTWAERRILVLSLWPRVPSWGRQGEGEASACAPPFVPTNDEGPGEDGRWSVCPPALGAAAQEGGRGR